MTAEKKNNKKTKITRTSGRDGGGIGIDIRIGISRRPSDDEPFILSQDSTITGGSNDDDNDHDPTEDYEPISGTTKRGRGTKNRKNSSKNNNTNIIDYEELLTNGVFPVSLRIGWKEIERSNGAVTSPQKDNEFIL